MIHTHGPEWVHWLEGLGLGRWVRESVLLYPALEVLHLFGAVLLVGPLIVLDLRLFGLFRALPVAGLVGLAPVLPVTGLLTAVAAGTLLFLADPGAYVENPAFRIKLVLIAIGLGNAVAFHAFVYRRLVRAPPDRPVPAAAKVTAAMSLALWAGVVTCGQWIPYV